MQVIEHVEELTATKEPTALGHALSLGQNGTTAGTMGHPGSDQPLLEAVLGHGLRHANVVETFKYATRRAEVSICSVPSLCDRHSCSSSRLRLPVWQSRCYANSCQHLLWYRVGSR